MDKAAKPGDSREECVGYYLERLERYLILCCETKAHKDRWDIFLWSARCAVEAMLLALTADAPPPTKDDAAGAKLIAACSKRGLIQGNVLPTFESITKYGNLGTHVWTDGQPDFRHGVKHCIAVLPQAVTWFFVESTARRPMPSGVAQALEVLSNNEPFLSPEEIEIEKLRGQARDSSQRLATTLAEKADLERQVARLKKQADERERHLEVLDRREPATVAGDVHPKEVNRSRRWGRLTLWAVLFIGLVGGGTYLVSRSRDLRGCGQNAPSSATTAEGGRWDASGHGPDAIAIGEGVEPDETAAVGGAVDRAGEREVQPLDRPAPVSAGPCPDGMVEVTAGSATVRLPHERPSWWGELPRLLKQDEFDVDSFCLRRSPVTQEELDAYRGSGASASYLCKGEVRPDVGVVSRPACRVSWIEAKDYCQDIGRRETGSAWSLPTIEQWESALEHVEAGTLEYVQNVEWHEWADDPYLAPRFQGLFTKLHPGKTWHLKPGFRHRAQNRVVCSKGKSLPLSDPFGPADCDFSWHRGDETDSKSTTVGFRCAARPNAAATH
jgi:hypothetical protein